MYDFHSPKQKTAIGSQETEPRPSNIIQIDQNLLETRLDRLVAASAPGGGARRPVHPGCSNAGLEAFNNGIKVAIRMAYGFHHVTNLIGLVMLRCGGLDIRLPQPAI